MSFNGKDIWWKGGVWMEEDCSKASLMTLNIQFFLWWLPKQTKVKAIEKEPQGVIILIRTDPSGIFGATGGQVGWLIELSEYSVSDIGEFGVKFT